MRVVGKVRIHPTNVSGAGSIWTELVVNYTSGITRCIGSIHTLENCRCQNNGIDRCRDRFRRTCSQGTDSMAGNSKGAADVNDDDNPAVKNTMSKSSSSCLSGRRVEHVCVGEIRKNDSEDKHLLATHTPQYSSTACVVAAVRRAMFGQYKLY
jgi:hypothetical protein